MRSITESEVVILNGETMY